MMSADRKLVRAGFFLLLLGLATGLVIPQFTNPRMGLAAHVTGVLNALLLVSAGLVWPMLVLSTTLETLTRRLFLFATFTNWVGSTLAATWGTSRMTPLTGAGYSAEPWKEMIVLALQVSVSLAVLTAAILVVVGLRPSPANKGS
jgi:hydroxylaminobenzene mutase